MPSIIEHESKCLMGQIIVQLIEITKIKSSNSNSIYFFYNKKYIITKIFLLCTWCDIRSIHIFCIRKYIKKKKIGLNLKKE